MDYKIFVTIYVSVILGLGFYLYKKASNPTPKYKAGDCIAEVYGAGEFLPKSISTYPDLIMAVGKKNYLVCDVYSRENLLRCIGEVREFSIGYINNYIQVDCKTGKELTDPTKNNP